MSSAEKWVQVPKDKEDELPVVMRRALAYLRRLVRADDGSLLVALCTSAAVSDVAAGQYLKEPVVVVCAVKDQPGKYSLSGLGVLSGLISELGVDPHQYRIAAFWWDNDETLPIDDFVAVKNVG